MKNENEAKDMNHAMALLREGLLQMNLPANEKKLSELKQYMEMVLLKNQQMNLTAIIDPVEFVVKHLLDSLTICQNIVMDEAQTIIDVGTGGGFPGIPLAIMYPQKKFLLMDSLNKRILFLTEAVQTLELDNVFALHGRAEDLGKDQNHREQYDLCVSRAVAKLSVLCEYCLPFVKIGGTFAAYKTMTEDLSLGTQAFHTLGGKLLQIQSFPQFTGDLSQIHLDHNIVYLKKIRQTPKQYPRKAGLPTKSPL